MHLCIYVYMSISIFMYILPGGAAGGLGVGLDGQDGLLLPLLELLGRHRLRDNLFAR